MKAVIDTCSLLALVRYYLPFDNEGKLKSFFENHIDSGEIIILDKVFDECRFLGQGQVIKALPFLSPLKCKTIAVANALNKKLFNMIDNNFVVKGATARLQEAEYQLVRDKFVDSADFAIVMFAYGIKDQESVRIVTEETENSNDGKPFQKIPGICKSLKLQTQSLPEFLLEKDIISMSVDAAELTLF